MGCEKSRRNVSRKKQKGKHQDQSPRSRYKEADGKQGSKDQIAANTSPASSRPSPAPAPPNTANREDQEKQSTATASAKAIPTHAEKAQPGHEEVWQGNRSHRFGQEDLQPQVSGSTISPDAAKAYAACQKERMETVSVALACHRFEFVRIRMALDGLRNPCISALSD